MRAQFVFSEIWQGLRRNLAMTVAVIIVTFVSLTFVGAALLMQSQVNLLKDTWFAKVEVTVFFCTDTDPTRECAAGEASQAQIDSIEELLLSPELDDQIEEYFFETKEEAYENFLLTASSDIANHITAEDMPASFRIKLVNPENFDVIEEVVGGKDGVYSVENQRDFFTALFSMLNALTLVSVGLAVVMLFAAALLISTTIRLSALSRQRETGIMRMVGASNWFVQLPFMLEGILAALFGAVLSIVGLYLGVTYLVDDMFSGGSVAGAPPVGVDALWQVAPILVVISVLLSGLASYFSLRRFTRV